MCPDFGQRGVEISRPAGLTNINFVSDLNPHDFWGWHEIRERAYDHSHNGRFQSRSHMIEVVKKVYDEEITQEMINNAVSTGFFGVRHF